MLLWSSINWMHNFVPIAIESLGPVNTAGFEFIEELEQRITVATGDPMETERSVPAPFNLYTAA